MLQAHSLLWHYLWVAPNLLLLGLALLIWRRGSAREIPAFVAFAVFSALGDLAVYAADLLPSVTAANFWRVDWASLLIESLLKFAVIGEVFSRVFNPYPAVSKLGRISVSGFGVVLILMAALLAAFSRGDSNERLISGAHLLEQTVFIIETGLILFLFVLAGYFQLSLDRISFGLLLGFGLSASAYLGSWALMTNAHLSARGRTLLDFLNMGTYHGCVLIWLYYLLVPGKSGPKPSVPPPDNNGLEVWNRELERLVHP